MDIYVRHLFGPVCANNLSLAFRVDGMQFIVCMIFIYHFSHRNDFQDVCLIKDEFRQYDTV